MKKFAPALVGLTLLTAWTAQAQTPALRSALVIALSQYDPSVGASTLAGVPHDVESARRIAMAMGIPDQHIRTVRDREATKENILLEIKKLGERTREGGRSFIYFSGHGTRFWDPSVNGCVEGLLSFDGQAITNEELARATQKVTAEADKVITMIDACHSGGVTSSQPSARSLGAAPFSPKFTLKANTAADLCSQPSNLKTRSLLNESTRLGALQENVVQITSSRPDEVSFDEPGKGGLATQGIRDCLLGKAVDVDGSGAVSLAEIQQCAQAFVNQRLQGFQDLAPHHVSVSGNRNLIPVANQRPAPTAVTSTQAMPAAVAATVHNSPSRPSPEGGRLPPVAAVPTPIVTAPSAAEPGVSATTTASAVTMVRPTQASSTQASSTQAPSTPAAAPLTTAQRPPPAPALPSVLPPTSPAPAMPIVALEAPMTSTAVEPALASLATLMDIEQQRDPRLVVDVRLSKSELKIGKDALDLSIKSSHDGFIYLVMLGSDRKSFYVLYPNGLDRDNRIKAGQTRRLPRPDWRLEAAGPPGTNHLLVMVSSSPRVIDRLSMTEPTATNPFTFTLNELGGRKALIDFLVHNKNSESSERFGARLVSLKEVL